jgi:hypothetical protein
MGWPEANTSPVFEKFERLDQGWNVAAIEEYRGADDKSPPTERYLIAKRLAEECWRRSRVA